MSWIINKAIVAGTDHTFVKLNCQDFCRVEANELQTKICGVVCDGCSSGTMSEVGAMLMGQYLLNFLMHLDFAYFDDESLQNIVQSRIVRFVNDIMDSVMYDSHIKEKVSFLEHNMMATFIFCVIDKDKIFIGRCGDGVIILNDIVKVIDENDRPSYIAYNCIPQNYKQNPFVTAEPVPSIQVQVDQIFATKIVIATDGLRAAIVNNLTPELYGATKRQLQRKFNVWQMQDKIFSDDTSCIVFEKVIEQSKVTNNEPAN